MVRMRVSLGLLSSVRLTVVLRGDLLCSVSIELRVG